MGDGGGCRVSAKESAANGAQINFEDLTLYLTYGWHYTVYRVVSLCPLTLFASFNKPVLNVQFFATLNYRRVRHNRTIINSSVTDITKALLTVVNNITESQSI
jgi:uncharacterized protein (DUF2225 family)